jgi:hypothetical protein
MNNDLHIGNTPARQFEAEREYLAETMLPGMRKKNPDHEWVWHVERAAYMLAEATMQAVEIRRLKEENGQLRQWTEYFRQAERTQREYIQRRQWTEDYQRYEATETANRTSDERVYRKVSGQPEPPVKEWEPALRPGLSRMQREASNP